MGQDLPGLSGSEMQGLVKISFFPHQDANSSTHGRSLRIQNPDTRHGLQFCLMMEQQKLVFFFFFFFNAQVYRMTLIHSLSFPQVGSLGVDYTCLLSDLL